ncbi:MAG: hypothetical protein H0U86_07870 [Chloroflexi bacterium]|nr:hypothetical protein [Chloroflexota bacterium]
MGTVAQLPAVDGRTLHLVDLENLIGDPYAKGRMVTDALASYLCAAAWRPGDLVYVASCPPVIAEIGFTPPVPCRLFAARGEDGADLQLLAHAPPELVRRRVERLVIGSGDHIFAPVCSRPSRRGSRSGSCRGPRRCPDGSSRSVLRWRS